MENKWYEKPMLISAVQNSYSDSYEILRTHTAKHFNAEQLYHLFADGAFAHYDDEKHGEALREYLKEARGYGISEIIYTNVHSIEPEKADPKWLQTNADGSYRYWYDIQYAICINDDYIKDLTRQLERLCTYDINGIFLDGPISTGACYCPHCKKLFSENFGNFRAINRGAIESVNDLVTINDLKALFAKQTANGTLSGARTTCKPYKHRFSLLI